MQNTSSNSTPAPSTADIFVKAFPPSVIGLMMVQIALVIGPLTVGAIFLGRYLDAQWNTRPWIMVGLLTLSSILSTFIVYRLGQRAVDKSQDAFLKWKEQEQAAKISALPVDDQNSTAQGAKSSDENAFHHF